MLDDSFCRVGKLVIKLIFKGQVDRKHGEAQGKHYDCQGGEEEFLAHLFLQIGIEFVADAVNSK